jgi:Protein of unknown function (DUF2934)
MPLREEISKRAAQLWRDNGSPDGRDEEFWLKAERELLGADREVLIQGGGAVSAKQYAESTDANAARARTRRK